MTEFRLLLEGEIQLVRRELYVALARCMGLDQLVTQAMIQQHLSLSLQGQVYLRSVVNVQLLRAYCANDTAQPPSSVQKERGERRGTTLGQASDEDFVMLSVQTLNFLVD